MLMLIFLTLEPRPLFSTCVSELVIYKCGLLNILGICVELIAEDSHRNEKKSGIFKNVSILLAFYVNVNILDICTPSLIFDLCF